MSSSMLIVALILFVLSRFHSPQLAGLTAFLSFLPGLLISPLAGALLDRHGRVKFIILDDLVAASAVCSIALLSSRHALAPLGLLGIVTAASLTVPLSAAGARSLFPIITPAHLWERANALDSVAHVVSQLLGAPLAGVAVALLGPELALVSAGALMAAAAVIIVAVQDPSIRTSGDASLLLNAWRGLVYTIRSASLRGIALTLSTFNLAWGALTIAIPVLLLYRLHQGPATVGLVWGLFGAGGLISALFAGRISTVGRERFLMTASMAGMAIAMAVLPFAKSAPYVGILVVFMGLANGPLDIGLFTLRQRRTDPAWFGRAFAVSMSINSIGAPVGSALAGPFIAWSLNGALWAAAAVAFVAAVLPLAVIPAEERLSA